MSTPAIVLSVVTALAGTVAGAGGDASSSDTWPQWRGPTRDGRCGGTTWPAGLQPDHLEPLWRMGDLGPSYSGPIVAPDRVFTTETRDGKLEVVRRAFDRATGNELWTAQWEGAMSVPFFANKNGSWIRSTPAWDGERLFVAGMRDVLMCLDGDTGATVWSCDFTERFGTSVPAFGFVCSPLVTDAHVYVQAGGALVKLDKTDGATVWRTLEDGGAMNSAFSSPVLTTLDDREQLLVQTRNELCGVAPEDGAILWRRPIKSFRGMNILTPIVHDGDVFTAPYGGRAQRLSFARSEEGATEGTFAVEQVWNLKVQGYMTSPVVIDGHAYLFTRSNRFACVDLATGTEAWTSPPTGDDYWSLVAQGDRILALSDNGRLRLIRATPERFEVVDEVSVADDQTWAHLAVAGGQVFVREQGGLAAFAWK